MSTRKCSGSAAASVVADRPSLASVYLSSLLYARFHTDHCNYDRGWPPVTNAETQLLPTKEKRSSLKEESENCEPTNPSFDTASMINSLEHSVENIRRLTDQVKTKKSQLTKIRNTIRQKINSKHTCCPPECTVEQVKKYLDTCVDISRSMIEQQKEKLVKAQTIQKQFVACAEHVNNPTSICSQTATKKQSEYIQKWNLQRFGWFTDPSDDHRVGVRIESSSSDTFSGRSFALVRGTRQCDNFDVVCNETTDISSISHCAPKALTPGALIAELQSIKYVNDSLRADILRLRSQHAVDWDNEKRQLTLLSGQKGDFLAILRVRTDGNITLTNVQYKPTEDHETSTTIDSANANLLAKLETFTPPLSNSLDEWISEVHDFCVALSDHIV